MQNSIFAVSLFETKAMQKKIVWIALDCMLAGDLSPC